jgi:hypothetical protein
MIDKVIIVSLIIAGLQFAFMQGNVLSPVRVFAANYLDKWFGQKVSKYIQKPLWGCMPCMASVWGLILLGVNIPAIVAVCGLNVIISQAIDFSEGEAIVGQVQETEYHDDVPTISRQIKPNG